jgi:DNA-binding CsgD family transcriptional regulator
MLHHGQSVLLVGPAGIGKTTLAARARRGLDVAVGGCFEALADRTYYPLSHSLSFALSGATEDVASEVRSRLDGRVLHIEDVHWADAATTEVLASLAGLVPMLLTSRVVPDWLHPGAVTVVTVEPLSSTAAAALAKRVHPELTDGERTQLVGFADGNPLLIAHLATQGRVSADLATAVADRLARLPADTVTSVGMLAVHGRPAPLAVVGLADDAGVGGVLVVEDGLAWFSHEQFVRSVLELLGPERQRTLRASLVERCDDIAAATHHLALGDPQQAARCAIRAAGGADANTRADMLLLAVRALGAAVTDDLLIEAADALLHAHRPVDVVEMLNDLPRAMTGDATVALRRVRALWMAGRAADALAAVDDALEPSHTVDAPDSARLLVERAQILVRVRVGDPEMIGLAEAALDAARRAGIGDARALNAAGLALSHSARPGWADRFKDAAVAARASGDAEEEIAANYWLVSALGFYGPMPEAIEIGQRMIRRADELGLRNWRDNLQAARAMHVGASGYVPDEDVDRCRELLEFHVQFRNRAQVELVLALARLDRDDVTGAVEVVEAGRKLARSGEDHALLCCADLEIALARHDIERAIAALQRLADLGTGFFGLNALAESAAINVLLREPTAAEIPRFSNELTPVLDVVRQERGAFDAWTGGDAAGAITGFVDAANRWRSRGLGRFEVRARAAAAELAMLAGQHDRAATLLDDARVASRRHCGLSEDRLTQLAGEIDHRRQAGRLTPRELQILGIVGLGATRQDVAAQLGLSITTVNAHIRSAMRKLGAHTSAQAAAAVSMAGPPPPDARP